MLQIKCIHESDNSVSLAVLC